MQEGVLGKGSPHSPLGGLQTSAASMKINVANSRKLKISQAVVVPVFKPRRGRDRQISEFEVNLIYIESTKTARTMLLRTPASKNGVGSTILFFKVQTINQI